jgi:hypothetical protein
MSTHGAAFPWKDALIPGVINALINGYISWNGFAGKETVALTVDSIGEGSHTAFGGAVLMAAALGLILSLVNFAMERKHAGDTALTRRESIRAALGMGLKNALFLFGLLACTALLWQKLFGTILVAPLTAALVTAFIAGAVSVYLVVDIRARHRALVAAR